jgi:hypothetical protein
MTTTRRQILTAAVLTTGATMTDASIAGTEGAAAGRLESAAALRPRDRHCPVWRFSE